MDERIKGNVVATLHGVSFTLTLEDRPCRFHLDPEALSYLRDVFATGLIGSPIVLFRRLFDDVVTVAVWKHAQSPPMDEKPVHISIDDARKALNRSAPE